MAISKVGVVGCGLMGGGIAQVVAQAGYATTVVEAEQGLLDRGLRGIHRSLDGLVDKGPRMVMAGHLGRKSGKGFYDHPAR